jgi:hypothetical protein
LQIFLKKFLMPLCLKAFEMHVFFINN